jgi:hypothetical protein
MRRAFLAFSALCLTASIMLAVMWVESSSVLDQWWIRWTENTGKGQIDVRIQVISAKGEVALGLYRVMLPSNGSLAHHFDHIRWKVTPMLRFPAGFWAYTDTSSRTINPGMQNSIWPTNVLDFPYWAAVLVLALPALLYLTFWKRRKRPGYCAECGYDLRASPDHCPECGTPTPAPANTGPATPTPPSL